MFHAPSHPATPRQLAAGAAGGAAAEGLPRQPDQGPVGQPGPGLVALAPEGVSASTEWPLRLAALSPLQDGGFAIAWFMREGQDPAAPWCLQVQRYTRTYARAGDAVRIPWSATDDAAAVTVLRDGTTIVAWCETVTPRADEPGWTDFTLCTRRFDPAGVPLGDPNLVHRFSHDQDARHDRRMDCPAISSWPDGSHVVGWADVIFTAQVPGLHATIQVRRYHANGCPAAEPVTVSMSGTSAQFRLQALENTGGYLVTHAGRSTALSAQVIRLLDAWNPIEPAGLSGLAVGSLLLPLGVCGSLLFAGRPAGEGGAVRWERQLFNWSGRPVGEPVPLTGPPHDAVPLRQLGQFLALTPSRQPGRIAAQRMDKYGALYGAPFDFPRGPALGLDDGGLAAAWVSNSQSGMNTLTLQRFTDPYGGQWLPE